MAEIKTIPHDKILVPERLRAVEEDHAFMIAQSIARIGLLNPVTVRQTPRAERPYTLVAGAHRLRGNELAGRVEIEAAIVKADMADAQMVEIEENVFRNELSALDRAVFVQRYRELWEDKHGWNKGGRPNEKTSANIAEVSEDSAQGQFFARVSTRMGLSRRAVEYAQYVAKRLSPELRRRLRGTEAADNQSILIKLAKLQPERQAAIALALGMGHALDTAIEATDPHAAVKAKKTSAQKREDAVISNFLALSRDHRRSLLRDLISRYPEDAAWAIANAAETDDAA